MPVCAPLTAAPRSASAKMMLGLLPPSSSVTRLLVSAAMRIIWRPTSVEPVNEILSTSGCRTKAAPAVEPPPVTTSNDRADDADRFTQRVAEKRAVDGQRVARDLVGPAAVVAQRVGRHRQLDLRL